MKTLKFKSALETQKFAADLSKEIPLGAVIALTGNLGAGKTTFTQGFAKGLGIKERITSPTFLLMKEYSIPKKDTKLYHLDLYRLENQKDVANLGLEELFNGKNIVLIEWAEKIKDLLPENIINIKFSILGENERTISIS